MEVLGIFGSSDENIDSWFMNHEPIIPTLNFNIVKLRLKWLLTYEDNGCFTSVLKGKIGSKWV